MNEFIALVPEQARKAMLGFVDCKAGIVVGNVVMCSAVSKSRLFLRYISLAAGTASMKAESVSLA